MVKVMQKEYWERTMDLGKSELSGIFERSSGQTLSL